MGKLLVIADGESTQAQNQAKGKLFENLIRLVLRKKGYAVDETTVQYSGMEIDIHGRLEIAGTPLYAECKCYSTSVDAPKIQQFYGKYMKLWRKDNKCHGIFIALPHLNPDAKAFYHECAEDDEVTFLLLEQEEILHTIFSASAVARPEAFAAVIPPDIGKPAEWVLIFTEIGIESRFFWLQYLVPVGSGISTHYVLFDSTGHPYLMHLL